jgi:TonB family protein
MSPRSLLFSSDRETSRQLESALSELGLGVEISHEIFSALKILTARPLQLIVIDWDEGLEGSFLLKTARELKSNQNMFAVVVGRSDARAALESAGADLVLSKPLQVQGIKHAFLACGKFVARVGVDLSRSMTTSKSSFDPRSGSRLSHRTDVAPAKEPRTEVPGWPSPTVVTAAPFIAAPETLSFATFETGLSGESVFRKMFRPSPTWSKKRNNTPAWLHAGFKSSVLSRVAIIGVVFFAVGYVFSRPITEAVFSLMGHGNDAQTEAQLLPAASSTSGIVNDTAAADDPRPRIRPSRIRVRSVITSSVRSSDAEIPQAITAPPAPVAQPGTSSETDVASAQRESVQPASRAVRVPESLDQPYPGVTAVREVAARIKPTLMEALEPVSIPAALSEKLLLERVDPSYPARALQAGLRGPVVLQAWIGKDGKVQELKLIRGPLLLGEAAFDAVRNWRFKPYLLNGEAVEAQTQVTVDFKLP